MRKNTEKQGARLGFADGLRWCAVGLLLTACATRRSVVQAPVVVQDSTHTATRYVYVERIDTVEVRLPAETAERVSRDTSSYLQTAFAQSWASVSSEGVLSHRLSHKPTVVGVPAKVRTERSDSLVYVYKEVPVPYKVTQVQEVTRLHWWHWLQVAGFWVLVGLWAVRRVLRKL